MRLQVLNIQDVAERNLCCGCGACASLSPEEIEMVDDLDQGRRPLIATGRPPTDPRSAEAMKACPGVGLGHEPEDLRRPGLIRELIPGWGPVLEVWEGYAADPDLRWAGSSGGAASGLALHCLEHESMHGVLHIAARQDIPYLNETVLSTTRDELLSRTGSRYAPASPCDGLGLIESAPSPCVFIGKPCDAAAVSMARKLRPLLDRNLGINIAFFCAGTPTTRGTFEMLKRMGVNDPHRLVSLRYRGNGWPGLATAVYEDDHGERREETLTYEQSWGDVLTRHKQWRCKVCADHTGELADISVGDPWYREVKPGESGQSLVVVRTERGRAIVRRAIESGTMVIEKVDPQRLPDSQPNLLATRGAVWGRSLGSRLTGMPAPRYHRMAMFRY
jgi:coenzyme F420 hydrogenase subunit beta